MVCRDFILSEAANYVFFWFYVNSWDRADRIEDWPLLHFLLDFQEAFFIHKFIASFIKAFNIVPDNVLNLRLGKPKNKQVRSKVSTEEIGGGVLFELFFVCSTLKLCVDIGQ